MGERDLRELVIEAYRLGYLDRKNEESFDPGHALDLLESDAGGRVEP